MPNKKPLAAKTLRPAPSSDALAQWITQGAPADDPTTQRSDDSTTQRPNDLTTQRSEQSAPQAVERASRATRPTRKERPNPPAEQPTPPSRSLVKRRDGERRQVTYYIGPRRAVELKVAAAERGTTMMTILGELVERWVERPDAVDLPDAQTLRADQHIERGPALVARADGSNRYRVNAYLDPDLAHRFKLAALRAGHEMSDIIDGLIELELRPTR